MAYGRQRSNPHEKHMGSYEIAAWHDAQSMAYDLAENFSEKHGITLSQIRKHFESIEVGKRFDLDEQLSQNIAEYLAKTESQRPAYERKTLKGLQPMQVAVFRVLCIIGAHRACKLLELRDRFRMTLAPGQGNRVTAAGAYLFCLESANLVQVGWPYEVFSDIGGDWDDDD